MAWKASSVMEERLRFVGRLLDGESMSDVCRETRDAPGDETMGRKVDVDHPVVVVERRPLHHPVS
jgi:hypothetical protein